MDSPLQQPGGTRVGQLSNEQILGGLTSGRQTRDSEVAVAPGGPSTGTGG